MTLFTHHSRFTDPASNVRTTIRVLPLCALMLLSVGCSKGAFSVSPLQTSTRVTFNGFGGDYRLEEEMGKPVKDKSKAPIINVKRQVDSKGKVTSTHELRFAGKLYRSKERGKLTIHAVDTKIYFTSVRFYREKDPGDVDVSATLAIKPYFFGRIKLYGKDADAVYIYSVSNSWLSKNANRFGVSYHVTTGLSGRPQDVESLLAAADRAKAYLHKGKPSFVFRRVR